MDRFYFYQQAYKKIIAKSANGFGILFANAAFLILTLVFPDAFLAWAWRIPFLISVVLIGYGALSLVLLTVTRGRLGYPRIAERPDQGTHGRTVQM